MATPGNPPPIFQQFDDCDKCDDIEDLEAVHDNEELADDDHDNLENINIDDDEYGEKQGVLGNNELEPVHIEIEDIQEELDYWSSSIICYVVEANPPVQVIEGFLRRI